MPAYQGLRRSPRLASKAHGTSDNVSLIKVNLKVARKKARAKNGTKKKFPNAGSYGIASTQRVPLTRFNAETSNARLERSASTNPAYGTINPSHSKQELRPRMRSASHRSPQKTNENRQLQSSVSNKSKKGSKIGKLDRMSVSFKALPNCDLPVLASWTFGRPGRFNIHTQDFEERNYLESTSYTDTLPVPDGNVLESKAERTTACSSLRSNNVFLSTSTNIARNLPPPSVDLASSCLVFSPEQIQHMSRTECCRGADEEDKELSEFLEGIFESPCRNLSTLFCLNMTNTTYI